MPRKQLTPATIDLVAERFRALGEPARLHIMLSLQGGELSVGELARLTEFGTANLSKHLQVLNAAGFVTRRKDGLYVYYAIAGENVFQLCELMCVRLNAEASQRRKLLRQA